MIYDPELTLGLPPGVTGPSAFNALAHSVEALYAPGCNPVTTALAMEGVRAIHRSLPLVMADPGDLDGRGRSALRRLPVGHGARRHVGGVPSQDLPRARRHVQPRARRLALGDPAARDRVQRAGPADEMALLADALGTPGDDRRALWDLAVASNVPTSLAALGLAAADLGRGGRRAAAEITDNPRPFNEADILALLQRAFAGERRRTPTLRERIDERMMTIVSHASYIVDAVRTPVRPDRRRAGRRCVPTTWPRSRCAAGRSMARPRSRGDRRGHTSATPTRRARTTATSPGWRCCWRVCRRRSRAPP